MNVLCQLLDPSRSEHSGSVRGRWELTRLVEDYAYSLVQHEDCANGYETLLLQPCELIIPLFPRAYKATSQDCPYLELVVLKDYPEGINDFQWGVRYAVLVIFDGESRAFCAAKKTI